RAGAALAGAAAERSSAPKRADRGAGGTAQTGGSGRARRGGAGALCRCDGALRVRPLLPPRRWRRPAGARQAWQRRAEEGVNAPRLAVAPAAAKSRFSAILLAFRRVAPRFPVC